ncbi:zinc-dependent alcohol dehydrogenase [Cellulomonas aerilata]|uniref:Oxidoreductase n=1 Tax=Cellulomonas aerilata TaxID=515326 RepID=A0A512DCN1_9CELL|nr:zinc-binding alcohol dehydrogenase [Cellulomonas aerilata]GEO34213.1 oxidoreductase [Cellulomonas aerilata]
MPSVVQLSAPGVVRLVPCEPQPLTPGAVRVRTWYSGISAGTELTAYRGSNPYLTKAWDTGRRLFLDGDPSVAYPMAGWGYSEVGEVVEAADDVRAPAVGEVVHGVWGHRSDAVVPAASLAARQVPAGLDPLHAVFARVGAIALNAVLAADVHLGERVAVFGQGVIGLLATRLARLSGGDVVAVDGLEHRLALARLMGATAVVPVTAPGGAGVGVRAVTGDAGVDVAIELSGSYRALHEAVRSVVPDGTVVASGFYQGGGEQLRLGEEFHHNRVRIVASQIGGTPAALGPRWDHERLVRVFMAQVASGAVDVRPLVTDVLDADRVAEAFARLDGGGGETLQVILRFDGDPAAGPTGADLA